MPVDAIEETELVESLRAEVRRLGVELVHRSAELGAMRAAGHLLEQELSRVAEERDRALELLSRHTWRGSLAMDREWHVDRGRKLAVGEVLH